MALLRPAAARPASGVRLGLAVLVLLVGGAAFGGCHLVIDGELGVVRCQDEGGYGPPACPSGEMCQFGVCAAVGAPIGSSCGADADCAAPASCFDPASTGQPGARRCSVPCCASTDCGDPRYGQVCWSPPDGVGGLCWPAAELGRQPPGAGRNGDGCDGARDCRSAVCESGACIDGCCDGSYCPEGSICRVKSTPVSANQGWACGAPPSAAAGDDSCNSNDDCRTAKCILPEPDLRVCLAPCCSSRECPEVPYMGAIYRLACSSLGAGLRGCATLLPPSAVLEVGASCALDEACRSGLCLDTGDGRRCSDLCCDDASCGDPSALSCRPGPVGGSWALRCVPK